VCPYRNVPPAAPIPPTIITVARDDARVPLWGPLKWAARLRDSRRTSNLKEASWTVHDVKSSALDMCARVVSRYPQTFSETW
jgi:protease II